MELSTLKTKLEEKMQDIKDLNLRPFVCEGSPLKCKVFIVGINPATQMDDDFWSNWNDNEGFLFQEWFKKYQETKEKTPKKNKKAVSPTRNMLNKIKEILKCPILETNVYPVATEKANLLKKEDKKTDIFRYLLENIEPQFIWIHGDKAIEAFNKEFSQEIVKIDIKRAKVEDIKDVKIGERQIKMIATQHLSYQFSIENAQKIANFISKNL